MVHEMDPGIFMGISFHAEIRIIEVFMGQSDLLFERMTVPINIAFFVRIVVIKFSELSTIVLSHLCDATVIFLLELLLLLRAVKREGALFLILLHQGTVHTLISSSLKVEHVAWINLLLLWFGVGWPDGACTLPCSLATRRVINRFLSCLRWLIVLRVNCARTCWLLGLLRRFGLLFLLLFILFFSLECHGITTMW